MTLIRLHITARLVASIMAVLSVTAIEAQEIYRVESAPAAVQLRTNGLYDLALCPNIGIEIQTDLGIAWQLDYVGAWWNSPSRNRFYSNYAFQTEIRYYLDCEQMTFPYTGHHIGLYGQMMTYDFEFSGTGYQSRDLDMTFGIGANAFCKTHLWLIWHLQAVGHVASEADVENGCADTMVLNNVDHLTYQRSRLP